MGLTIHYKMQFSDDFAEAVKQVEKLRNIAMDLPFETVSDSYKFVGKDQTDFEKYRESDHPYHFWFLIQASRYAEVKKNKYGSVYTTSYTVPAKKVVGFTAWPGAGSEVMNIGVGDYPKAILIDNPSTGRKNRIPTKLTDSSWSSFCKTQYASDPECGGIPNFLKCHLLVVRMLDEAIKLGVKVDVNDESDYFIHRDLKKLAKEVGEWNEMIASFVGAFKDEANKICPNAAIEAPILEYPNFEHLEAKGYYKDNPTE